MTGFWGDEPVKDVVAGVEALSESERRELAYEHRGEVVPGSGEPVQPRHLPPVSKLIEVGSIKRLDVRPGETLVVALPAHATMEDFQRTKEILEGKLPGGVQLLVTQSGVKLSVVAKTRSLPLRRGAYSEEQWAELETWVTSLGLTPREVCGVDLTDDEVTVTSFKLNEQGRKYAVGDEAARTYRRLPLADAPAWLPDLAA